LFFVLDPTDETALSLHLEVALAVATPKLLDDFAHSDSHRRRGAVADVARYLAERLRCFDICDAESGARLAAHPSLLPDDLEPMARS
jgi:hypothetical protein